LSGHLFRDKVLLRCALTHSSLRAHNGNYERLEFLGDRVLGLVVSEMIYNFFPSVLEGELSLRLNVLVNADTCAQVAEEIGLPDMIRMGMDTRFLEKRRIRNIYADVVESLIAVLYLEGGLKIVRPFISLYWSERVSGSKNVRRDAKTALQEWAHKNASSQPVYRMMKRTGLDHDPVFEVQVEVCGFSAQARGSSKRRAELAAAEIILSKEGVW
jgi:ribonuclease-3